MIKGITITIVGVLLGILAKVMENKTGTEIPFSSIAIAIATVCVISLLLTANRNVAKEKFEQLWRSVIRIFSFSFGVFGVNRAVIFLQTDQMLWGFASAVCALILICVAAFFPVWETSVDVS